jgi:hypothetical protein
MCACVSAIRRIGSLRVFAAARYAFAIPGSPASISVSPSSSRTKYALTGKKIGKRVNCTRYSPCSVICIVVTSTNATIIYLM